MGNRGSIQVVHKQTGEKSVVLFRHWSGDSEGMIELCRKARKEHIKERIAPPYDDIREIIARLTKISVEELKNSAYLGKDEDDGDNSDNGHFILEVWPDFRGKPGPWFLVKGLFKLEIQGGEKIDY